MTGWLRPLQIPIEIGRDEARRRALAELAKAKYGGTPDWVLRASETLQRLLDRLIELYLGITRVRQSSGGGVNWGFVLAIVLLLVAIGLVVWRVGLPRWQRRRMGAEIGLDSTVPATDYRQRADDLARRGEWAGAVGDRFRALVRELEVRTILDIRPARTAWEAAYSASRSLTGCTDALHDAAAMFNDVVYGQHTADAAAYQRMVAFDQQITAAADQVDLTAELTEPAGSAR